MRDGNEKGNSLESVREKQKLMSLALYKGASEIRECVSVRF